MTGGPEGGSDTYAHTKDLTSFTSYLERIRPGELVKCLNRMMIFIFNSSK